MCELVLKPKYKAGQFVSILATEYLNTFKNHGHIIGKIKQAKMNVHNKYVPEYEVETDNQKLVIPEYSIEDICKKTKQIGTVIKPTQSAKEVLLF